MKTHNDADITSQVMNTADKRAAESVCALAAHELVTHSQECEKYKRCIKKQGKNATQAINHAKYFIHILIHAIKHV